LIGAAIAQGLTLLASIITARLLGKVSFGELGMIRSTVGMFGVFAGFGLGLTATKHVAELRTKDPDRAGRIVGLSAMVATVSSGAMCLGVLIIAPTIAARVMRAPHLLGELRIGCALLFVNALNGAQTGVLAGFEAFKTIAKVNLAAGALSFPILVVGVWLWSLPGAIGALAASAGVGWVINHAALRAECRTAGVRVDYRGITRELPVLWRFSVPALLCGSATAPATWVCHAMLVNQPDGYAEMGTYAAAYQWRVALLFLPAAVGRIVVPIQSSLFALGNKRAARRLLGGAMLAAAALSFPLALVLILLSGRVMGLYGASFANGGVVLAIVVSTAALLAVQQPVGQVIVASGRMWTGAAMNLGWAAVLFVACWFLVRAGLGAKGLAMGFLIAYAAHGAWTLGYAMRVLGTRSQQSTRLEGSPDESQRRGARDGTSV
jgi:O-antigen/teichoic acid export membrane protein